MKLPLEQICLMLNIFGFPYESKITLTKKLVQQNIRYRITRMYFCLVTVSKFASGPWWDCETVGGVLGSSPLANRTRICLKTSCLQTEPNSGSGFLEIVFMSLYEYL